MIAVGAAEFERFLSETEATDDFYGQLEAWGVDPSAFGQLLDQYSTHSGEFHREENTPYETVVVASLVAGFEMGYRARMAVEDATPKVTIPDTIPLG